MIDVKMEIKNNKAKQSNERGIKTFYLILIEITETDSELCNSELGLKLKPESKKNMEVDNS